MESSAIRLDDHLLETGSAHLHLVHILLLGSPIRRPSSGLMARTKGRPGRCYGRPLVISGSSDPSERCGTLPSGTPSDTPSTAFGCATRACSRRSGCGCACSPPPAGWLAAVPAPLPASISASRNGLHHCQPGLCRPPGVALAAWADAEVAASNVRGIWLTLVRHVLRR